MNENNNENIINDEIAIKLEDVHKSYGNHEVLKGLNLEVKKGELFGFIGKNGVGKSTTIDCITGVKRFEKGTINLLDYDISKEAVIAKSHFGYVASEPICYENMTGYEYLEFVASVYKISEGEFVQNYQYLAKRLDLKEEQLNQYVSSYSHGMKQKLCLIASLIHNPKIWILDEPTVGLDAMAYESLISVIQDFVKNGRTVLITSHNLDMVGKLCNRVAIINEGVVARLVDLDRDSYFRTKLNKVFFAVYGGE